MIRFGRRCSASGTRSFPVWQRKISWGLRFPKKITSFEIMVTPGLVQTFVCLGHHSSRCEKMWGGMSRRIRSAAGLSSNAESMAHYRAISRGLPNSSPMKDLPRTSYARSEGAQ
jgi:hypothetical protein